MDVHPIFLNERHRNKANHLPIHIFVHCTSSSNSNILLAVLSQYIKEKICPSTKKIKER
jgi:hypothetical protein